MFTKVLIKELTKVFIGASDPTQVSLEILIDGKTEEKSRALAAILMATWRAMVW